MKQALIALLAGVLFGFGVSLSGMTNPNTVLQFLDVTGAWNITLLFVLASAVSVTLIGYRWVLKMPHPLLDAQFHLPSKDSIDRKLALGASLFGIGWGIAGYCPGAVIAALAQPNREIILFVCAMLAGMVIGKLVNTRKPTP